MSFREIHVNQAPIKIELSEGEYKFDLKHLAKKAGRARCNVVLNAVEAEIVGGGGVIKKEGYPDQFLPFYREGDETVRRFTIRVLREGLVTLFATEANLEAPEKLFNKLFFPLGPENRRKLTHKIWGERGSLWGNDVEFPYFWKDENGEECYEGYVHEGVDFLADEGDPVFAVAPGKVARVGFSGEGWGHYVAVEHEIGGEIYTAIYEHLQEEGRPQKGDDVLAGQMVGQIIKMTNVVPGEVTHLHFSMHKGSFRSYQDHKPLHSNAGAIPYQKLGKGGFFNAGDKRLFTDRAPQERMDSLLKTEGYFMAQIIPSNKKKGEDHFLLGEDGQYYKLLAPYNQRSVVGLNKEYNGAVRVVRARPMPVDDGSFIYEAF